MKNVADLVSSARTVHDRFVASRMERETVREWVLGLGDYPEPYATAILLAKNWFRPIRAEGDFPALKSEDAERIHAIIKAGARP